MPRPARRPPPRQPKTELRPLTPRRIAVYLSAHGLGHAVRAAAVLDQLQRLLPIELTVIGPCEPRIWPLAPVTPEHSPEPTDTGVVQSDDVTVDLEATRARLATWLSSYPETVAREAARLRAGFDLVVGDVPAPAFEAAARVGIPSVAVANFSWDWIFAELGFGDAAAACAEGYAKAGLLLEATPSAPMPAFTRRENVGLIAREPSARRTEARRALGVEEGQSLVLIAFQPRFAGGLELPAQRPTRRYAMPPGWPSIGARSDTSILGGNLGFEDALAAADVVVGKPGYGLIGDVEAGGKRFLYAARPGFPENEVLERHLGSRGATTSIPASRLASGEWEDDLAMLENEAAPAPADARGAERAARAIARLLGVVGVASHVDTASRPE